MFVSLEMIQCILTTIVFSCTMMLANLHLMLSTIQNLCSLEHHSSYPIKPQELQTGALNFGKQSGFVSKMGKHFGSMGFSLAIPEFLIQNQSCF